VWDVTSLLVGIVIGTAIFKAPAMVFGGTHSPLEALGLWLAGGAVAFAGALCYAELAAAYPRSGGDYEYLSRAYGRWLGLQFTVTQLLVVLTGSVGSMSYAFADYARGFASLPEGATVWLAIAAIGVLTVTNLIGLRTGRSTQNLLTVAKLAGLVAVVGVGLTRGDWSHAAKTSVGQPRNVGLAMVMILYAYAGWSHAAYVSAEVDRPQRNLPRALLRGVGVVTLIYAAVNLAYVLVLGFDAARSSQVPAADVMRLTIGERGAQLVSLLVVLSALGAINGTILTGAILLAELGHDYRRLGWLRRGGDGSRPPVVALLLQSCVAGALVFAVGTSTGRDAIDGMLTSLHLAPAPWEQYYGGFDTLVSASAPLYWGFLLLTGTTVFVLRYREPHQPRPFRIPGYPLTPLVFCAACVYMLDASLSYAGNLAWIGLFPIAAATVVSGLHHVKNS
jgi:amino acid transporter